MAPNKSEIIHTIKTKEELKNKLGLWVNINIPEFKQTLEFTQSELDELKESIIKKPNNEIFEILKDKIKEKTSLSTKVQWEAIVAEAWLKKDMLRQNVETPNSPERRIQKLQQSQISEIKSIDLTKWIDVQFRQFKAFEFGMIALIQHLSVSWVSKEILSNKDKFKVLLTSNKIPLDDSLVAVKDKYLEASNLKWNEINDYFDRNWDKITTLSGSKTQEIREIQSAVKNKKEIPETNTIKKYAKEHPYIAWAVALAWAYGLYKIFWSLFGWGEKESGSKEKWFFSGILDKIWGPWKWILWGVLWIFGLGKVMWLDGTKDFFRNHLGFDIDENRITKAIELFSEGKIMEWIKVLFIWVQLEKLSDSWFKDLKGIIKKEQKLDVEIDDSVFKWVMKMNAKDFIIWWNSLVRSVLRGLWMKWKELTGFSNESDIQENAIRDYLKKQIDEKKIEIWKTEKVEDIVTKIFPQYLKEGKANWESVDNWAKAAVVAWWVWTAVVAANSQVEKPQENWKEKADWKTEWSLSNPFLYVWMKWKRFEIGKAHTRWSIRKYISSLEWKAMWIPDSKATIKELETLESLLQKWSLSLKEQQSLENWIEKFLKKNPSFLWEFKTIWKADIDSLIKDPELKKWLLEEQLVIKEKAIDYHNQAEKLRKAKYEAVLNWEKQLRELSWKKDGKFSDIFKANNKYSPYNLTREAILKDIQKIDDDILKLNNWMNSGLEKSLWKINWLYETHSLPTEKRIKITKWILWPLEWLWVKFDSAISRVPGSWIVKGGLKIWFIWLIAWSLVRDWLAWKESFKWDATEVGLGLLPITSEILDFKAALTWHDLAWRDLKAGDRWMRAWFWVVWTIADAATLITFGQSQWARTWLAWAKWTAKVADIANDASKLDKMKDAIFAFSETSKFTKTVQMANTGWKLLTFGALWLATYDIVWDISGWSIKEKWQNIASQTREELDWLLKKAA